MYRMICSKYGRVYKAITGHDNVLPPFLIDINSSAKRIIQENKTSIVVIFPGEKYSIKYTVPIACKKYIGEG